MGVNCCALGAFEIPGEFPVGDGLIEGCPLGFGHGQDVVMHVVAEAFAGNFAVFPALDGFRQCAWN